MNVGSATSASLSNNLVAQQTKDAKQQQTQETQQASKASADEAKARKEAQAAQQQPEQPKPVVNTQGQKVGRVISVTA